MLRLYLILALLLPSGLHAQDAQSGSLPSMPITSTGPIDAGAPPQPSNEDLGAALLETPPEEAEAPGQGQTSADDETLATLANEPELRLIELNLQQQDLNEQRAMAKTSQQMVAISTIQMIISGVGALLLIITLNETRKASTASRIAADATKLAAEAAVAQAKHNRAWIGYDDGAISLKKEQYNNSEALLLSARFKNLGQSPAIDVTVRMGYQLVPEHEEFAHRDIPLRESISTFGDLAPNGTIRHRAIVFPIVLIAFALNLKMIARYNIKYRTIYDQDENQSAETDVHLSVWIDPKVVKDIDTSKDLLITWNRLGRGKML